MWARAPVRRAASTTMADRDVLGFRRPAAEEVVVLPARLAEGPPAAAAIVGPSSACTMSSPSKPRSPASRPPAGRHRVAGTPHAGVEQEALETEDPGIMQGRRPPRLAGTAPPQKPDVDVALPSGRAPLDVQRRGVDRRWDGVERHVDDRGDAAGGRGAGRRREALPLGSAGLVDVYVRVHEPRDEDLVAGELDHAWHGMRRLDGLDRADAHRPRRRRSPARRSSPSGPVAP